MATGAVREDDKFHSGLEVAARARQNELREAGASDPKKAKAEERVVPKVERLAVGAGCSFGSY